MDAIPGLYEVARPLSNNLKGGYHISCPFGYVGRGRVRVVTHGLNLPRHGTETARRLAGLTQSGVPAKTARREPLGRTTGRSIKPMVQPRKISSDGHNWESPIEGQTLHCGDTRRSCKLGEKARVARLRPAGKPVELPPMPIAIAPRFYSTEGQLILLICWSNRQKMEASDSWFFYSYPKFWFVTDNHNIWTLVA